MRPFLIVNPASACGATGRNFDRIARAVRDAVGAFDCAFTSGPGDGARLARSALRAGGRLVVAVGGDGTAGEVVDGLLDREQPGRAEAVFGCIPRGTAADLGRTVGWSTDLAEAAQALAHGPVRAVDVGRLEFTGHDGRTRVRHFANVAGFGVSGAVVAEVEKGWKVLGGRLGFLVASAKGLAGYRDQPVRYRLDGGEWREERITSVAVCNGRFFGAGMMVAPGALIDDGLFDVTIWKGLGLLDFVVKKRMLYDGSHLRLPNARAARARLVEAEPLEGAEVLLDVDGEQLGRLPARFGILPGALRLRAGI